MSRPPALTYLCLIVAMLVAGATIVTAPSSSRVDAYATGAPAESTADLLVRSADIGISNEFFCVIRDGGLECWGKNEFGQLGDGTMDARTVANRYRLPAPLNAGVTQVTTANRGTCAVANEQVYCWGLRQEYLYDPVTRRDSTTNHRETLPVPVKEASGALLDRVVGIAINGYWRCALREDPSKDAAKRSVWCWGYNIGGLGFGVPQGTPAQLGRYSEGAVKILEGNISAVSLGSGIANAACVIMADTRVQCWGGTGARGQLGRGDTLTTEEQVFKPAYVLDEGGQMGDAVAIASGNGQHCVLKSVHSVHCWGSNASGSLADGTAIDRSVAVPSVVLPPDAVSSGERVVQLGLDISKGYAVTDANTLYEWGGTYTFSRDSDEKKQAALTSNKPRLSRASGGNNRGNTIAVLVENQGLCPVRTDFTLGCLPVGSYPPLVQPVPAPPNMAPVTVSENSATVTASASSEGATPTSIVVTATPGDPSPTCTINVAEGHTTCTVSPLTPGTAYTFEAIARNTQGDSGPSAAQTVTTGAVMKPAQPTVVVGDEELTVTPQPSDGGGTPTGYIVSVQPGGLTCEVIRPELSCTIGNLTNGTDYTVTMSAFNEANVSNPSDPVNIVVGLPATPQEPTITVGDGRATVTISPSPTISANTPAGSPSYFTVTAMPGEGTCTVTPPDTACDVIGLTNGVEYTFTTTATNGWGTTSASTPVIELVDVKPNPPTQPTVVVAVGGVTVSSLPAGTGGSTQTITVSATPIDGGAALTCTITPPATDCFIAGLTQGTT